MGVGVGVRPYMSRGQNCSNRSSPQSEQIPRWLVGPRVNRAQSDVDDSTGDFI